MEYVTLLYRTRENYIMEYVTLLLLCYILRVYIMFYIMEYVTFVTVMLYTTGVDYVCASPAAVDRLGRLPQVRWG